MKVMTKIKCLILLILFSTPLILSGQVFNMGLKAGVNSNEFIISTDNYSPGEPSIGFAGGLFLRVKPGFFSIQPEVLFSHKTGLFSYSKVNEGLDTFFRASMQNVDFPIIANFHLGKHLRIGTGPVVSYNIGEKVSFTSTNADYTVVIDKDIFKKASYSWQFAGAFELRRLVFEARYELGIDKLNYEIDIPGEKFAINPVIHTRTWQFTLGYKFVTPR